MKYRQNITEYSQTVFKSFLSPHRANTKQT